MLVEARRNEPFRSLLNRTVLNLPDSTGLLWAAKWTGQSLPSRVTGVDTVRELCASLDESVGVFFLGAAPGVAEAAAAALKVINSRLKVAGTYAGSPRPDDAKAIVDRVNASDASLLLVAYGSPAQDRWIDEHLKEMPAVKVAMGIGGTFDFLAGTKKRAPAWMRGAGLEWLYRFAQEPSRWKRMWNAVVVFPWLVISSSGETRS
jgi:N-acetylglucosaminyldiphosphoundecaprenol N-acetyl-beta-D-mannosaminyltransferase